MFYAIIKLAQKTYRISN